MATKNVTLSKTVWTKLTAAGESGAVWKKAGEHLIIDHTDSELAATLPLSNTNVTIGKSKRVPLDKDSNDILSIVADNGSDIYYGLAIGNSESNILALDIL